MSSRCEVSSQAAFVDIPSNWFVRVVASTEDLAAESTYLIETTTLSLASSHATVGGGAADDDTSGDAVKAAPHPPRRLHLALSGGSTPKRIYESFAQTCFFKQVLDRHAELHLWYGDVRMVPDAHADSNARMVMTALDGTFPPAALHPVDVGAPAAEAAARYSAEMLEAMPSVAAVAGGEASSVQVPVFDILLLGMGPDGHTASLFPGTDAPSARGAVCVACMPGPDVSPRVERVTITAPVIEAARHVVLIVAGAEKKAAFRGLVASDAALAESPDWMRPVIRLLRQCKGSVHILADRSVAEDCFVSACAPINRDARKGAGTVKQSSAE